MNKRLISIDGDNFSGWCCSRCTWGITTPVPESTVATLAFNRVAQEDSKNTPAPRRQRVTRSAVRRIKRPAIVWSLSRRVAAKSMPCSSTHRLSYFVQQVMSVLGSVAGRLIV